MKYLVKTFKFVALLAVILSSLTISGCLGTPVSQGGSSSAAVEGELAGVKLDEYDNEKLQVDLDQFKGKVVLINFWASWCGPCKEEAPLLEAYHKQYEDEGLVIIGINVDDREHLAKKFILEQGWTFTNRIDKTGQIADQYQIAGMPNSFFYNRNGEMAGEWLGAFTEEDLEKIVKSLI